MKLIEKKNEYAVFSEVLPNISNPLKVIRRLNHSGQFEYDNFNVKSRLSLNDHPYFTALHHQLFEDIYALGFLTDCKPSYNFLMQYLPGSEMYAHTDREQCKFNFGLQIYGESPFYIEAEDGVDCITLKPNMGILYSGTDNKHWLPPEEFYRAACVFHFVDKSFKGSLK